MRQSPIASKYKWRAQIRNSFDYMNFNPSGRSMYVLGSNAGDTVLVQLGGEYGDFVCIRKIEQNRTLALNPSSCDAPIRNDSGNIALLSAELRLLSFFIRRRYLILVPDCSIRAHMNVAPPPPLPIVRRRTTRKHMILNPLAEMVLRQIHADLLRR